jgi:AraC-like DNA-binding protein
MIRRVLTDVPGIGRLCELGHRESMVFPGLLGAWPAQIHSAGFHSEYGPSYDGNGRNPGYQGLAAIRYTLSGRGWLRTHDGQIPVEPGQAVLLYFPYEHHYWIEAGEQWESFYITFTGREVIGRIREVADRVGPVLTLASNSPTLARAAEACADALERKIESPQQGSASAHAILMELLRECCPPARVSACRSPSVPAFVIEVEEFCRQNYARPIGVADMARVAKMSRFHFTRLFHKAWGISPGRYLGLVRLEDAMHRIREGGFTVKDLAQQCGFSTANYFCKAFRKHYGVAPGGFKVGRFVLKTPRQLTMVHGQASDPAWRESRAPGQPPAVG